MEPSNAELMTHIQYIREKVDDTHGTVKAMSATVGDHETRITVLEATPAPKPSGGWMKSAGTFVGGLVSGFTGGKLAGQ